MSTTRKILSVSAPQPWKCAQRIATPVVQDGVAYMLAGDTGGAVAFKLSPLEGDIVRPLIEREVAFNVDNLPYSYYPCFCASPLLHEGLLYCLDDFGILTVVDMTAGQVLYQRLLDVEVFMPYTGILKGGVTSSPTLGGKDIYIWGNQGSCVILEPGRTFKPVAKRQLLNPDAWKQEATTTDPVFEGNRMYYRGENTLYCIGPK